jgi:hypothetical protein
MTGAEATDTSDATEQRPRWSLATLIAFRFGTCYFGSFGLALVIGLIPVILAGIGIDGPWSATRGLIHVMRPPIEWTGTHLLGCMWKAPRSAAIAHFSGRRSSASRSMARTSPDTEPMHGSPKWTRARSRSSNAASTGYRSSVQPLRPPTRT